MMISQARPAPCHKLSGSGWDGGEQVLPTGIPSGTESKTLAWQGGQLAIPASSPHSYPSLLPLSPLQFPYFPPIPSPLQSELNKGPIPPRTKIFGNFHVSIAKKLES
ncbi:hypothetical protein PoB_000560500 [Plakobranchus ocellatus]|uniref:Uncharacterized protein n=1 Tax=Plakobranchus ocellatus TaxID=259542 RepID=A0AAV3Y7J2_9GAST|nr:hypothetical protein PoB_000560500 [Plakobranchus ocellatus]